MNRYVATALLTLGTFALPHQASGHSLVRDGGAVISYLSADATSVNTLTVRLDGDRIEFRDPTVDGGLDPGTCAPGDVNGIVIVQVLCPASGVQRLRIDLGEREDKATVSLATPATLLGGPGADRLGGGAAGDELSGGEGDDVLDGGEGDDAINGDVGADTVDGGPGADWLISRDGLADIVRCGDGVDVVDADTLDDVAADCEQVANTATDPPSGSGGDEPGPPALDVGAQTFQRPGASRLVRVYATSSEPGTISASGILEIAGLQRPVLTDSRRIEIGGAGVAVTYKIPRGRWEQARQALARDQPVSLRLGVVATDLAGNTSQRDAPLIEIATGGKTAPPSRTKRQEPLSAWAAHHPEPGDADGDEVRDEVDNCPTVKNGQQINTDRDFVAVPAPPPPGMPAGDALGDACDPDDDADGIPDAQPDNCRLDRNPDQADGDGDGYGDVCPPVDSDADGQIDDDDNCDLVVNPDQGDLDGDDTGDACDRDDDGDRFDDGFDNCPTVYNLEPTDTDGDGLINDQLDGDGDGVGTACDPDESVLTPPSSPPPETEPEPDRVPPEVSVRAGRGQSLEQLRAGMIVRVRCSEACAGTAELVLSAGTARRIGLGESRVIAGGSATLDAAGTTFVFVRLDRRASATLRRHPGVRATLSTTVVDPAGNLQKLAQRVKLAG